MRRLLVLLLLLLAALPAPAAPTLASQVAAKARSGGVVLVSENQRGFYQRLSIGRGKHLIIRASTPVVFSGQGAEHAFRVLSGGRLTIEGPIDFVGYDRALFVTTAEGLTVRGARFLNSLRTPILTGKTSNVRVEGCTIDGVQDGHGVYVSEGGSGSVIQGNTIRRVSKCSIQANACPYKATGLTIRYNTCTDAGNAGIQVTSFKKAVIAGNSFARVRTGVSIYDDGRRKCRCEGVDLRGQVGPYTIARSSRFVLLPPGGVRTATLAGGRRPAH